MHSQMRQKGIPKPTKGDPDTDRMHSKYRQIELPYRHKTIPKPTKGYPFATKPPPKTDKKVSLTYCKNPL